jgi:uncharacterized membrane protein
MSFETTNRPSDRMPAPETTDTGSSGFGEIAGLAGVALIAMGMLAFGYTNRTDEKATVQASQPAAQPSTALGATPQTQYRSPGNDTPAAPTQSTTGQGPDNGSTGTPTSR